MAEQQYHVCCRLLSPLPKKSDNHMFGLAPRYFVHTLASKRLVRLAVRFPSGMKAQSTYARTRPVLRPPRYQQDMRDVQRRSQTLACRKASHRAAACMLNKTLLSCLSLFASSSTKVWVWHVSESYQMLAPKGQLPGLHPPRGGGNLKFVEKTYAANARAKARSNHLVYLWQSHLDHEVRK